jgi:radical SAM protein with 4Fe4S-binding SPASM domain
MRPALPISPACTAAPTTAPCSDLVELDGEDLRPHPLLERKKALRRLLRRAKLACSWSSTWTATAPGFFAHACKLGCAAIVSKRRDSPMRLNKHRGATDLWGFCQTCRHADTCRGGCTWTADAIFGRRGNNPYCHHRVLSLAEQGLCERLVKVAEAGPGLFATGRFQLVSTRRL